MACGPRVLFFFLIRGKKLVEEFFPKSKTKEGGIRSESLAANLRREEKSLEILGFFVLKRKGRERERKKGSYTRGGKKISKDLFWNILCVWCMTYAGYLTAFL